MTTGTPTYEEIPLITGEYIIAYFDGKNEPNNIDQAPSPHSIVLTNKRIIETSTNGTDRNSTFGDLNDSYTIHIKKTRKTSTPLFRALLLMLTSIVSLIILPLSIPVYTMAILFFAGGIYHISRFMHPTHESHIAIKSSTATLQMIFMSSNQQNAYVFINRFFEVKAHLLIGLTYPSKSGNPEHPNPNITDVEIVSDNPSYVENEFVDPPLDQTVVHQKASEGSHIC